MIRCSRCGRLCHAVGVLDTCTAVSCAAAPSHTKAPVCNPTTGAPSTFSLGSGTYAPHHPATQPHTHTHTRRIPGSRPAQDRA